MITPHPRRRFFRYSLRTLMIVVTVFCVWMGITAKRARDQRLAVEAILEAGGEVNYEHQVGHPLDRSEPPGPEWLRQLIGDEYFFSVNVVFLHEREVDDATLAAVSRLTGLTNLFLDRSNITDAQLVHLKGLTNLLHLDLSNTHVTDAGMVHLKSMTNLRVLKLASTKITDSGLMHLKGLTNLGKLELYNTQVTDEGMKKLKPALPNCYIVRQLQIDRQSP